MQFASHLGVTRFASDPFFILTNTEGLTISKKARPRIHIDNNKEATVGSKIERLKRDHRELRHYIKRVEKEGNDQLVFKLQKKYDYLGSKISDIEEELITA